MPFKVCSTCGAHWTDSEAATSYFFSSASFPKGSYTSAKAIIEANEDILTCPLDEPLNEEHRGMRASTPSRGNMMEGDNRSTAGDETHPSKDEL